MTIKEAISNYAYSLPINLKSNQALKEMIIACIKPAFNDAILNSAGNVWKIRNFESEVSAAKSVLINELTLYFDLSPIKCLKEFNALHRQICDKLIRCFPGYNAERKNAGKGRRVGFTYGNAQKFVNMAYKNIFAILTINADILPNFKDYFIFCHMPFDSYIYNFIKIELGTKIVATSTPWSTQTNYEVYLSAQDELRKYISTSNTYLGRSLLEAEFDIWEKNKPKNQNQYANEHKNYKGKQNKNTETGELGESIVLTELVTRGYAATRTSYNAADVDIIAISPSGVKFNVQVKAKSPTNNTDEWSIGSERQAQSLINRDVWFIFVDLSLMPTSFYIEHCVTVLTKAKYRKDIWDNGFNRKTSLPHKADPRLFFRSSELLDENGAKKVNNWDDLP